MRYELWESPGWSVMLRKQGVERLARNEGDEPCFFADKYVAEDFANKHKESARVVPATLSIKVEIE